jgi:hypothetical protein
MGKAATKLTQALGFSGGKADKTTEILEASAPRQWDTATDQLFGDAPPDADLVPPQSIIDTRMEPAQRNRRRRAPLPPSMFNDDRRSRFPSTPARRSQRRRRAPPPPSIFNDDHRSRFPSTSARRSQRGRRPRPPVHAMRTPIIPDMPKRIAKRGIHAVNGPFGVQRWPMIVPTHAHIDDMSTRIKSTTNLKRQASLTRRRRYVINESVENHRDNSSISIEEFLDTHVTIRLQFTSKMNSFQIIIAT